MTDADVQEQIFFHLAWDCSEVEYWRQVFEALAQMTALPLEPAPLTALLGYTALVAKPHRRFISLALMMAKCCVACRWGRGRAPKFKDWLSDLTYCQEKLCSYAELLSLSSRPRDIWDPLKTYLAAQLSDTPEDTSVETDIAP